MALSASEYRASLSTSMTTLASSYTDLLAVSRRFSSAVIAPSLGISVPSAGEVFERFLTAWVERELRACTAAGQGVTDAALGIRDLPTQYSNPRKVSGFDSDTLFQQLRRGEIEPVEYAAALLQHYDFDGLAAHLMSLELGLEERGFKDVAERLAQNLRIDRHRPTIRGRTVTIPISINTCWRTYSSATASEFATLAYLMGVVEEDTGQTGLKASMEEIKRQLGTDVPIHESRTKLCDDHRIKAVVYQNSVHLRLPYEVFESIVAFIRTWAPEQELVFDSVTP